MNTPAALRFILTGATVLTGATGMVGVLAQSSDITVLTLTFVPVAVTTA
jgi:hypothetical protein